MKMGLRPKPYGNSCTSPFRQHGLHIVGVVSRDNLHFSFNRSFKFLARRNIDMPASIPDHTSLGIRHRTKPRGRNLEDPFFSVESLAISQFVQTFPDIIGWKS